MYELLVQKRRHVRTDAVVVKETLSATRRSNSNVLVPQVLLGNALDLARRHSVDRSLDLLWRETLASGYKLATNVFRNRSRAIQAKQERSLELRLRTGNLRRSRTRRHALPLLQREVDKIVNVHVVLTDHVHTPETRVRVRCAEVHERISEVVRRHNVRETARHEWRSTQGAVPVAKNRLHHEHREVVRRLPARTLNSNREVDRRRRVVTHADLRAHKLARLILALAKLDRVRRSRQATEVAVRKLDKAIVLDTASANKHHAVSSVLRLDVRLKVRAVQ